MWLGDEQFLEGDGALQMLLWVERSLESFVSGSRSERQEKAAQALAAAADKIDAFLESNSPRMGLGQKPAWSG
jgi:hypothetical protein